MRSPRKLTLVLFLFSLAGVLGPWAIAQQAAPAQQETPGTAGWKIKFDGTGSSPVMADGVIYLGSGDGAIYALDSATGRTKWQYQTGLNISQADSKPVIIVLGRKAKLKDAIEAMSQMPDRGQRRVEGTAEVDHGMILISSSDLFLYAIDVGTGRKKWAFETKQRITYPKIRNGLAYFVTSTGLHALDVATGEQKWLFAPSHPGTAEAMEVKSFVMGDGAIFVTTAPEIRSSEANQEFVYAVDPESGKAKWNASLDGVMIGAPLLAKGMVYVSISQEISAKASRPRKETLYGIDAASGQIKWKFDTSVRLASMQVAGNVFYFSTGKNLLALDAETGKQLWTYNKEEPNGIFVDDQSIYVTAYQKSNNILHALSLSDRQEKWSAPVARNAKIVKVQDGIVYTVGEHALQATDAATGKELWSLPGTDTFTRPLFYGGRIFVVITGLNNLVATKTNEGFLYAIDARTGKP